MNKEEEEFIKKYVKLSNNARTLVDSLDENFDLDKFIDWWIKNRIIIADAPVLEYLYIKRAENDNKNS